MQQASQKMNITKTDMMYNTNLVDNNPFKKYHSVWNTQGVFTRYVFFISSNSISDNINESTVDDAMLQDKPR